MAGLAADATTVTAGLLAAGVAAAAVTLLVLRFRGPRGALRGARRAFQAGDHRTALDIARKNRPLMNAPPKAWHEEQRQLESEVLYAAGEAALRDRRYAEALDYFRVIATLMRLDDSEATNRVIESMLAELRLLSAANSTEHALSDLVGVILKQRSPCPEASFWLGLYHLRREETAQATKELEIAYQAIPGGQVDTCLYLGTLWLRDGRARDALRVLSEANRLAPNCPLVAWLLGSALMESGGDALLALRALQKATAADGLPKYLRSPHKLWSESLPADSWIRNITQRAATPDSQFQCPLGLDRIDFILQRARLALAEALVTCERAEEAVPIFTELLKSNDSLQIRRGLGLAFAQLERHDDALPHLRHAHSQENPPTPATTSALALSLAKANGDRMGNIRRALALIASMKVRADANWARRAGTVFAVSQAAGVPVSPDEVAELVRVLVSTSAADATAAALYDLFAGLCPNAVPREAAWLYARAAQKNEVALPNDQVLLDQAMADRKAARAFFTSREWDFDAVERLYLERWAKQHPGTFPTAPGPGYAAEAESALLSDAQRLAAQGRAETARDLAKLVLTLNPSSGPAHDRLAELAFRRGDGLEAVNWLHEWRSRRPDDPVPFARLAAIASVNCQHGEAYDLLRQALDRVSGPNRLHYLLLGARLALAAERRPEAVAHFDESLTLSPNHPTALIGRAAVAWSEGNFARLVKLAERMATVQAEDPWFHYHAAAAFLLAGQLEAAELSARQTASDPATAAEGRHLLALIRARRDDAAGAADLLRDTAVANGVAADHAAAMRGQAAWQGGDYSEALRCWQNLPAARLKTWNLTSLIGGTAFMAGLQALRADHPEEAAKWLRQAARLGHADPRLEQLLTTACTRAGGQSEAPNKNITLLEQALQDGGPRPEIVRQLARAYRLAGRLSDARQLLDRAAQDDVALTVERGLLTLAEGQLVAAERAFASAFTADPKSAAACINLLFARLSLGRVAEAIELLPRAVELAPTPNQQRLFAQMRLLAGGPTEPPAGWSTEDDRAVVQFLRSLGRLDSVEPLFAALARIRGQTPTVRQAQAELVPLIALARLDRGDLVGGREILEAHPELHTLPVVRNLLGVLCSLRQDFGPAIRHFQAALPTKGDDARVQQNLAIVRNWFGDAERSEAHWRRFLDSFASQMSKPATMPDYHKRIAALVRESLRQVPVSPRGESRMS